MTINESSEVFPTYEVWMNCVWCAGHLRVFNKVVRPTEILALLKCENCSAHWEAITHLRPHTTESSEKRQMYRDRETEKRHRAMAAR